MPPDISRIMDLDLSVLPFPFTKDDWHGVLDFPTTEDMLAYLAGHTNEDMFMVETALSEALGREKNMTVPEVLADMQVVLPRWAAAQKRVAPIGVGQWTRTRFAGSEIEFQITRTEEAYFHFPPEADAKAVI